MSMESVWRDVEMVAPTNATVLVTGETGVGKEVVARRVHEQSRRNQRGFLVVNCGALSESLIESELFGHAKGAFTGALCDREGVFEEADTGTVFLDEIGELPLSLQPRLLRVLETGEVRSVGRNRHVSVDVRVVAATNRDLRRMVELGEFREDLFYRVKVFEIEVPPVRARNDWDVLIGICRRRFEFPSLSEEVDRLLRGHSWPGNVREMINTAEYLSVSSRGCSQVEVLHLPPGFASHDVTIGDVSGFSLKELEVEAIKQALTRNPKNKAKAAEELGVSLKTLYNKIHNYGMAEQCIRQGLRVSG